MRKWKKAIKCLVVFMMLCAAFLGSKTEAEAASRMRKLKVGKTYTTKLTGNEKHKVKFTYTKGEYFDAEALNLYVDGEKVKTIRQQAHIWNVFLCKISPKRTLLCVEDSTDNDYNECMKILEYKDNQMTELADLAEMTRNTYEETDKLLTSWARCELRKVEANKLVVRWMDTGAAVGIFNVDIPYKISAQEIRRGGSGAYALKKTKWIRTKWTANRSITTYTAAGGSKASFTVRSGEKVTGVKMTRKNGNLYFQIKNARGKKGWFKDSNYSIGQYFKEAVFAG